MFLATCQPLTNPDTQITSYGEWLLLNGKTSPEDLEEIGRVFFPFVYVLSLVLLGNPDISRRCSVDALASALHAFRRFPGGGVQPWLASYTLAACRRRQLRSNRNYQWAGLKDVQEATCWGVISALDVGLQVQAVLYFRFSMPRHDIARICNLPVWLVNHHLNLARELCTRQLLWAGISLSRMEVEQIIHSTLEHQIPAASSDPGEQHQLGLELASALTRKASHQHRRIIVQQVLFAVIFLVVLLYLSIK